MAKEIWPGNCDKKMANAANATKIKSFVVENFTFVQVSSSGITVEITEPTSDVAHQKADDQTQLERTWIELSKSFKNS